MLWTRMVLFDASRTPVTFTCLSSNLEAECWSSSWYTAFLALPSDTKMNWSPLFAIVPTNVFTPECSFVARSLVGVADSLTTAALAMAALATPSGSSAETLSPAALGTFDKIIAPNARANAATLIISFFISHIRHRNRRCAAGLPIAM